MTCASEPVSWLRLERYALGELTGGAAQEIADHLAACDACRACLDHIKGEVIALPPLPARAAVEPAPRSWWASWWSKLFVGGGMVAVAAAAAVLLFVRTGDHAQRAQAPALDTAGPTVAIKGTGEIQLALIRERGGHVEIESHAVDPGDRLKLRVTCPPTGGVMHADVVVFQPGADGALEAAFPLAPRTITCANEVTLDGAFRITPSSTGSMDATVCLALDARGPVDRKALAQRGPRGDGVACVISR